MLPKIITFVDSSMLGKVTLLKDLTYLKRPTQISPSVRKSASKKENKTEKNGINSTGGIVIMVYASAQRMERAG